MVETAIEIGSILVILVACWYVLDYSKCKICRHKRTSLCKKCRKATYTWENSYNKAKPNHTQYEYLGK